MAAFFAVVALGLPGVAPADVTISTATTAPQYGDGGTFTVTTTGTITGSGDGVVAQTGNAITTLTINGVVDTSVYGVRNFSGSTISEVGVSGTIQGSWGFRNDGAITNMSTGGLINANGDWGLYGDVGSSFGTVTNTASGTIQGANYGIGVYGTSGTIANAGRIQGTGVFGVFLGGANVGHIDNSGVITGGNNGVWNRDNSSLTTFTNSGLVSGSGDWGFITSAGSTVGTLTNTASGTIQAANYGIGIYETTGTISNAGLVKGTAAVGLWTGGGANNIAMLQNTGTFTGGLRGVQLSGGSIGTFTNAGLVNGDYDWGVYVESGSLGTLANSGTIQSAFHGIGVYGTSGTISNTGLVNAPSGYSVYAEGDVSQFSNAGTMTATAYGAYFRGSGLLASASNSGLISGGERAFQAENGSLGTLTNSGTMAGGNYGVLLYGTTGTVANLAGGRIEGTTNDAVYLIGSVTQLSNSGTITAGGLGVYVFNAVTTATNSGLIQGHYGIKAEDTQPTTIGVLTNSGTIEGTVDGAYLTTTGTVLNLAGGRIAALNNDAVYVNNTVSLFSNAGTISGDRYGAHFFGTVTAATNSGLIEGGFSGMNFRPESVLGTLTNSGTIRGGPEALRLYGTSGTVSNLASGLIQTTVDYNSAVVITEQATIPSLVNEGRIIGARTGVVTDQFATLTTLTNSGTIAGQAFVGVFLASQQGLETLSNSGLISGFTAGVRVQGGPLNQLINTGTITYTGTGTGPAVFVSSGGILGVASGTAGVALSSTGTAARLEGTIQNRGTIYHGFTVDNQDVTISAGGGAGTFTDGTLTVTNGNLTFTSGTTTVAASVSANAGAGTVINDAGSTVRFVNLPNRTANFQSINNSGVVEFQQAAAGSFALPITGTGSVLKTGTGNLTLAGTSSYTGATTVSAGRLSVNGILGDSPVAVLAAAELGGSGSIAGPVSVASGGFLSPGNSIASLATGTATFAAGSTFEYEVDSTNPLSLGSAADLLVVTGDLILDPGNGSLLTVTDLAGSPNPFVTDTTRFALINYSGTWNGGLFSYAGSVLANGGTFTVGSQRWTIAYDLTSSDGLDNFAGDYLPGSKFVALTAMVPIPEPSTYAMALAGLACGGFSIWRRRKRA